MTPTEALEAAPSTRSAAAVATPPRAGGETRKPENGQGENFRMANLGRHSLVYALGVIATKAVAFIMLPIYTNMLQLADYGILQLTTMFLEVLSIFAGSRIAYGIFHFYHKAQTEEEKRTVLSTATILLGIMFGLVAALALIAAPWIAEQLFGAGGRFVLYVRLAALGLAFESLITVPNALFQLRQQSVKFVSVSLLRLGLQVALNLILLVGFGMGIEGVLLTGVISNLLVGGFLVIRLLRTLGARFHWPFAYQALKFGLPLVVMQIATFIFTFGDRYFLKHAADATTAAGLTIVGLYGLAYQFGFLVGTIGYIPIEMVWDPQRFAVARRPDRDAVFSRVFAYVNVVLISAAVGLCLFVGDLLRVIADPAYHGAAVFIPVIVGAYIFQAWGTFFNIGIMLKERTHYWTVANWAAALVAIAGYLILIPRFLAWGAAFTVVASLGTRFWLTHYFSQRLLRIEYEWGPVLRLIAIAASLVAVSSLLPALPWAASVGVHALLFCIYAGLVWRLILTADDRSTVRAIVLRLRARTAPAHATT